MSKIALNLKEFQHISSDKKSTKLRHKDGHELTIAHSALSPEMQKQLAALSAISGQNSTPEQKQEAKMADGGKVETEKGKPTGQGKQPDPHPEEYEQTLANGWKNLKNTFSGKAEGGEVKQYAEGDMVEAGPTPVMSQDPNAAPPAPVESAVPQSDQKQAELSPEVIKTRQIYNDIVSKQLGPAGAGAHLTPEEKMQSAVPFQFSATDPNQTPQNFDPDSWRKASEAFQIQENNKQMQESKDAQKQQDTATAMQQAGIQVPAGMVAPPQVVPSTPPPANIGIAPSGDEQQPGQDPMQNYANMLQQGFQHQIQGIEAGAQAQGQLGQQQSKLYEDKIAADKHAQDTFQNSFNELNGERQAIMKDINEGYISPDHYWKGDPSTGDGGHSKIAAGIGMILAGFNPTSNPNAAINFLNKQMDMSLQAQAHNLNAKQNLLAHNIAQFGNIRDAATMTRIQQNDMLSHQLGVAASKAQGPMAKAAALQARGQIEAQNAPLMMQLNMNRAMINLSKQANNGQSPSGNPTAAIEAMLPMLRQVAPERAKEWESRLVPGVGVASVPLGEEDRKEIMGKTEFDKMAKQYMQFAQKHSGSLSPDLVAQGKAMALNLQNAYRNATHGGVYKEGEQEMITKIIPADPTQFFNNLRTSPKLKQLIQDNNIGLNTLKSQKGMATSAPQQAQGYVPKSFKPAK